MAILFMLIIAAGCASSAPQKTPEANSPFKGVDLRYTLYGPAYVATDYSMDERWSAGVNITNVGTAATDAGCIRVNLVNNRTGAVEDSRYLQFYCGRGCLAPGSFRSAVAAFSPGPQEEGYYRVTAESCSSEYPPVAPLK